MSVKINADELKKIIKKRGWTQTGISRQLGMSEGWLHMALCAGTMKKSKFDEMCKLLKVDGEKLLVNNGNTNTKEEKKNSADEFLDIFIEVFDLMKEIKSAIVELDKKHADTLDRVAALERIIGTRAAAPQVTEEDVAEFVKKKLFGE